MSLLSFFFFVGRPVFYDSALLIVLIILNVDRLQQVFHYFCKYLQLCANSIIWDVKHRYYLSYLILSKGYFIGNSLMVLHIAILHDFFYMPRLPYFLFCNT
jgi:hypothetical protein